MKIADRSCTPWKRSIEMWVTGSCEHGAFYLNDVLRLSDAAIATKLKFLLAAA